jgi:hypothetical protein
MRAGPLARAQAQLPACDPSKVPFWERQVQAGRWSVVAVEKAARPILLLLPWAAAAEPSVRLLSRVGWFR